MTKENRPKWTAVEKLLKYEKTIHMQLHSAGRADCKRSGFNGRHDERKSPERTITVRGIDGAGLLHRALGRIRIPVRREDDAFILADVTAVIVLDDLEQIEILER